MRVFGVFLSLNGLLFILCEREKFYYFLCPLKIRRVKGGVSVPEMMKILPFGPLSGKFHLTKSPADNIIRLALRRS